MQLIDLRSDTVTWPTPAMRQAMAAAEVGDDVKGEDPTVNRLEALAAELLGKEAALFVASGTQANLIALLTHCGRGDEIITGLSNHIYKYEGGGMAAVGGIQPRTLPVQPDGTLRLEDIEAAVRSNDVHYPFTRLVSLENTHGGAGGAPVDAAYTQAVRALCDRHGLLLHIDGARIWNAAAALGVDVRELAGPAHSVSFCLSKGLCAPVGSLVCGSEAFIARARRVRKVLGGGMRQAGVLAAAGIIALEQMTARLAEDHARAAVLAAGVQRIEGLHLDHPARSNMVFFSLDQALPVDAAVLAGWLRRECAVAVDVVGPRSFRAVTHYWIDDAAVETVLDGLQAGLAQPA